jgi:hypothetical protein
MAYDRKKAGRSGGYYYQSVRVDGRAVKRYVGNGPEAERLAAEVEQRRLKRLAEKQLLDRDRNLLAGPRASLVQLNRLVQLLAQASLILAGFHNHHRGTWRKDRCHARASSTPSS